MVVAVGDTFPDVTLQSHAGNPVNLLEIARNGSPFVVFLYPRASTPGCTRQAQGFAKHANDFRAAGYSLYGLSADSITAQNNFCSRSALDPLILLSDPNATLVTALGSLKEPGSLSVLRSHYIVAAGGKIVDVLRPAKPEESVEKALEYCTSHPAGSRL